MTREEAIKEMIRAYDVLDFSSHMDNRRKEAFNMAKVALEQEPRKGHWIKTPKAVMCEGYMWYCNKCKHQVYQDSSRPYPSEKYCPNCGSDNREVEE